MKNVTMISIDNLLPGALVNYNSNEFTFFVSDLTVNYKGGQFSMSTVDGSVTTKNEEKTVNRVSNTTRIRKLQVKQDQESLKLDIIAKELEKHSNRHRALLRNSYVNMLLQMMERFHQKQDGQRLHQHGIQASIYGRERLLQSTILLRTVRQSVLRVLRVRILYCCALIRQMARHSRTVTWQPYSQ